jgi:hypothetical protein
MFFLWSRPTTTCPRAVLNRAARQMRKEPSDPPGVPPVAGGTVPGLAGGQECDFRRVQGSGPIGE